MTLRTTFANVQQLWLLAVEQPILVQVVFANAVQVTRVLIQGKLAVLEHASAEQPQRVLVR